MPNPHRGEIEAILDGHPLTLCLTLGALAELETALDCGDILALAERFEAGRISAKDAIAIIGAGLRGAGADIPDTEVARLHIAGGVPGTMRLVADLLKATFADA